MEGFLEEQHNNLFIIYWETNNLITAYNLTLSSTEIKDCKDVQGEIVHVVYFIIKNAKSILEFY